MKIEDVCREEKLQLWGQQPQQLDDEDRGEYAAVYSQNIGVMVPPPETRAWNLRPGETETSGAWVGRINPREVRNIITEKASTRAFSSWLKAPTSAFTHKNLLRHYAKQALTHSK